MSQLEQELKERIKELTCLYEVSSILVNADSEQLEQTFRAIAFSLKKAFQFPEKTTITIESQAATANNTYTQCPSVHCA